MKKNHILITAAMIAAVPVVGIAQTTMSSAPYYTVKDGDNLWNIAGHELKDPLQWEWIYQHNPELQRPGLRTIHHDGRTYVTIQPRSRLYGLDRFGNLTIPKPISTVSAVNTVYDPAEPAAKTWSPWWWMLVLGVIALLTILYGLYRTLTKDAVRSRAAVVPGGVDDDGARERFSARAHAEQFRILEQVAGRGYGVMNVQYADGRPDAPRLLNGERMYRATVRHSNGSTEELYMLQGCGNDLRPGALNRVSRYVPGMRFRFEADPVQEADVAAAPVTAPTPAPEAESMVAGISPEAPTADREEVAAPPIQEGVMIELRRADGEKGNMLRVRGVDVADLTLNIVHGETTIRFTEKAVVAASSAE